MLLKDLKLRSFRNYRRLDWKVGPGVHALVGRNGQGKSNLLEAIYMLITMKSYRGARHQDMILKNHKGYFIGANIQSEIEARIKFYWGHDGRKLSLNEESVSSLRDYLGVVKGVIFSSEDIQLIRGSGKFRRRFIDLICSQIVVGYLEKLQAYAKALKHRNALLKRPRVDQDLLQTFSHQLIQLGNSLTKARKEIIPQINSLSSDSISKITSGQQEQLEIQYKPSVKEDFKTELEKAQKRDLISGTTSVGPHRDDLAITVNELEANSFASEGQQRSIVIALKLTQVRLLKQKFGYPPILLIDDVFGELDLDRKKAFIPLIERINQGRSQVFLTATDIHPLQAVSNNWNTWEIKSGSISPINP